MTFWKGLLAGRSHLAFLGGLALALAAAWAAQRAMPDDPRQMRAESRAGELIDLGAMFPVHDPAPRRELHPLTPAQQQAARSAWAYLKRNTRESGLVDSVEGYPATTLWDAGSALMGVLSAEKLGLIPHAELIQRAGAMLDALARAPLLAAGLPNRSYDTRTLAMVDYTGKEVPAGTGWSAIDIGRLGIPLQLLVWTEPELTPKVRAVLARWQLDRLSEEGELRGGDLASGTLRTEQEGRLGYEQYAAASLALLGVDASRARLWRRHLAVVQASGVRVPADDREPRLNGNTPNPVTSEPFILLGAELGFGADWLPLAQALLKAQERHTNDTGVLTAVSEDHIDRAPFFVYYSVTEGGRAWVAQAPDGADASAARTLSYKAALGWGTLFAGAYADKLLEAAAAAPTETGWISGRYESGEPNRTMTVNTNGVALELLAAQVHGPWLPAARRSAP